MTDRRLFTLLLLPLVCSVCALAQMADPVRFSTKLSQLGNNEGEIVFSAVIDAGWHLYSSDINDDGPVKASFHAEKMEGAELVGKLVPRGKVTEQFDDMFGMTLRFFEEKGAFVQKVRFKGGQYVLNGYLEYGACNDQMCLPPSTVEFAFNGEAEVPKAKEKPVEEAVPAEEVKETPDTTVTIAPEPVSEPQESDLWASVTDELQAFEGKATTDTSTSSWWFIFLEGFLGGLLAILTPCVWPIIPMTVSFFLKRNKERRKAISEAVTYGLSIVFIYVLLGLAVTLLFGASALNALSTNAIFNIFFALLLVVFAASFFGAFELTLPSSWANKVDQKSEATTGLLSIFLMAFTLALVSFSCTGPIIGFLLVAVSTQGDIVAPTIGMLGFAVALAIPFTLFALFPSLLKQVPKSGSWMNTVKVVLGFIELAFALKFLSVADLAYSWHLLDREVFLSLWITLFALLGFYLLGWLKFPHDDPDHRTGVGRFFLALVSLAFAVYMVPGLWGAPLKAISAFAPPMNTQDFNLHTVKVEAQYTNYDLGMAAAREQCKPVMVDFTGFGCVNCRKMEAAVWTDPQVRDLINNRYVLISLFVDDKTPLPEPIEVTENGTTRKLRTVGDKWSYLQRTKIGANTQPFYVLLDPDTGKPLNGLRSYDEDIAAYVDFLQKGLDNYHPNQ
ncbi:MAG: thioredoxin family protein [Prevotella sp.]|nr:thioredoxin family protein [Prevotella sp.]